LTIKRQSTLLVPISFLEFFSMEIDYGIDFFILDVLSFKLKSRNLFGVLAFVGKKLHTSFSTKNFRH